MARLLEFIEHPDPGGLSLVSRVPRRGGIRLRPGGSCMVGRGQSGVVLADGAVADVLAAGRHRLNASTLPGVYRRLGLDPSGDEPIPIAIAFVGRGLHTDLGWGDDDLIQLRDAAGARFGFRIAGTCSIRVADPGRFIRALGEARVALDNDAVIRRLRDDALGRVRSILRRSFRSLEELTLSFNDIATEARLELKHHYGRLGVDLVDFFVTEITPGSRPTARADRTAAPAGPSSSMPAGRIRVLPPNPPLAAEPGVRRGKKKPGNR